ncbi:MAG: hypothetical protein WAO12_09105, partial [Venatoribacter sp.]
GILMSTLYIAISTGQNVANIPPIIEQMQPQDSLVWLETSYAHNKEWTQGAFEVLKQRGLKDQRIINIGSTNQSQSAALQLLLQELPPNKLVTVVGNGGTKLQLLLLWQELINAGFAPQMLYGEWRPCAYQISQNITKDAKLYTYQMQAITLEEVLMCSGHLTQDSISRTKIWPAKNAPATDSQYGIDAVYSGQLHASHQNISAKRAANHARSLPRFNAILDILKHAQKISRLDRLFNGLNNSTRALLLAPKTGVNSKRRRLYDQQEFLNNLSVNPIAAAPLFNQVLNLAEDAAEIEKTLDVTPPKETIGPALENAVAVRVFDWLNNTPHIAQLVTEAHAGVRIAHAQKPDTTVAEFDVVLVLKNGVLINLECKSFDVKRKDMDARTTNLRQTSSNLAKTYVVLPIFTEFAHTDWFEHCHEISQLYESVGFTLKNQPLTFQLINSEDQQEINQPYFEDELTRKLSTYL